MVSQGRVRPESSKTRGQGQPDPGVIGAVEVSDGRQHAAGPRCRGNSGGRADSVQNGAISCVSARFSSSCDTGSIWKSW